MITTVINALSFVVSNICNMINNHIKSWNTNTLFNRVGHSPCHGFFMAYRRTTCQERLGNRMQTSTENKKEEII